MFTSVFSTSLVTQPVTCSTVHRWLLTPGFDTFFLVMQLTGLLQICVVQQHKQPKEVLCWKWDTIENHLSHECTQYILDLPQIIQFKGSTDHAGAPAGMQQYANTSPRSVAQPANISDGCRHGILQVRFIIESIVLQCNRSILTLFLVKQEVFYCGCFRVSCDLLAWFSTNQECGGKSRARVSEVTKQKQSLTAVKHHRENQWKNLPRKICTAHLVWFWVDFDVLFFASSSNCLGSRFAHRSFASVVALGSASTNISWGISIDTVSPSVISIMSISAEFIRVNWCRGAHSSAPVSMFMSLKSFHPKTWGTTSVTTHVWPFLWTKSPAAISSVAILAEADVQLQME